MNEIFFLGIVRSIPKPHPPGTKRPRTPPMSPVIHDLRGKGLRHFYIATASIAASSGLVLIADIYKNIVFLKLRNANIVLAI